MIRDLSAQPSSSERGAALMTVIMMVAMMSALAISVVEAARFSIRRTGNQEQMEQAHWYLRGAEAYATSLIERGTREGEASASMVADWLSHPVTLPVEGGAMQITVWDGSNCFNVNSVVLQAEDGGLIQSPEGIARLALLLELSGVQGSRELAASLADWIDSDDQPVPGGAEALAYGGEAAVFRPSNTLMSDIGELPHVAGFDASVIDRVGRLLCVRPTASPNSVNVETLRLEQARLLAAMVGRGLSLASAEQVISDRPSGGWSLIETFLNHPRMAGLDLSDQTKAQFARRSDWYVVGARVQYRDVTETSMTLVRAYDGRGQNFRRVFGTGVGERRL